ncbi:integral membrane protein [Talaromyces pinophilus]|uniref:Integral membrane protein n=1 Tax=Talaromyces pinophilus TaxID=128442 RepID=A0A6V8HAA0_TALPI|nr:integral membrane protein [Talaromyces pinophilus]
MDCKLEGSGYSVAMPDGVDTISLDGGNLRISFHRTIRVPDSSASKSLLPPDLGVFPLFSAKETRVWMGYAGIHETEVSFLPQVPEWLKTKGGAQNGRRYAIKVYAGGVNAVSGLPSITAAPPGQQDYVFVAVPLGKNRTVEGQITGSEQFAGIQFEIVKGIVWKRFRVYCADGTVITLPVDDRENVDGLCRIISEKLGKTLEASDLYDRNKMVRLERSRNENLRETRLRNIGIVDSQNTSLLEELYKKERHEYGYELSHSTDFIHCAEPLMSWESQLGLAAGGFIKQHIQKDTHPASTWDHSTRTVFNVQLLSAQVFEEMTGFMAPAAPINAATYHKYNLSFFNIPEPPSTITSNFGKLKSLAHLSYID